MTRMNETHGRVLRTKVLPGCLALALAVGSDVLSPEYVNAEASSGAQSTAPFVAAIHAPGLSARERQFLIEHRRLTRTPMPAPDTSIGVTNCNDSGPGSYRQAMSVAVTGDTIDLTSTGCSTITLTTGDIILPNTVGNLTLQGPPGQTLEISGGGHYRPLEHPGTGTLTINDMVISNGKKYLASGNLGIANGGCIETLGAVDIESSAIVNCNAGNANANAGVKGGAVYGKTAVTLGYSLISGSTAQSTGTGGYAYGGGVFSGGALVINRSLIVGNHVAGTGRTVGGGAQAGDFNASGGSTVVKYSEIISNASGFVGGGLYTTGNVTINNSTIADNQAAYAAGVAMFAGSMVTAPFTILSSTISGNTSTSEIGGVNVRGNALQISNSTIAFNTAQTANKYGAGLHIGSSSAVDLESTIISGNTTNEGGGPLVDDAGGISGASFTGANNLIYFTSSLTPPPGTITFTNPLLSSLADNGGPTPTHALSPNSPAINQGNNIANVSFDERGPGYPRVIGAGPDIGAFELNLNDVIFANGFD